MWTGYIWGTIHEATNPDPLAALCGNLIRARWFTDLEPTPTANTILERARRQIRLLAGVPAHPIPTPLASWRNQ